jgi:hypothetical protein
MARGAEARLKSGERIPAAGRMRGVGEASAALRGNVLVPTALGLAFLISQWLIFDVSFRNACLLIGYELGFVIVPGILCYILVTGRVELGLEQLAFGWALGYALELGAFAATAAGAQRGLFVLYPLLVAAIAVPYILVKIRRGDARPVTLRTGRWTWCVAIVLIVLFAYLAELLFSTSPLPGTAPRASYYSDQVWFVSLTAEARHHWPLQVPNLAGLPLHYQYFYFLHLAAVNQVTGVPIFQGVFRSAIPILTCLVFLQFIHAGRALLRSRAAGIVAAALFFLVGTLKLLPNTPNDYFPDRSQILFGMAFFLPLVTILGSFLAGRQSWRDWRSWILIFGFLVSAVGAKLTILPVLLGAVLAMMLYALLRVRGLLVPLAIAAAMIFVVLVAARVTVYRTSSGLEVAILGTVKEEEPFAYLVTLLPSPARYLVWGLAGVLGALKLLSGLIIGLAAAWILRRSLDRRSLVWLTCLLVASIVLLYAFVLGGQSQFYFFVYGYAAGCLLAGCGFVALWRRFVSPLRVRSAAALAAVALVLVLLAIDRPLDPGPKLYWQSLTGTIYAPGYRFGPRCDTRSFTPGLYAGLRWVATHTPPDAVLAVNNQYIAFGSLDHCNKSLGQYFYYSAFSERRVMLEGYYSSQDKPYPPADIAYKHPSETPYPERFRITIGIFARGSRAAVRRAEDRFGVRYLVIDRVNGLQNERSNRRLHALGNVVFQNSAVEIIKV